MNNVIITKNQEITLENRGILILKPADHVATGGEGSVYKPSNDTIIKIYSDPQKMQKDGMAAKIGLLKKIQHQFIVAPKGLVYKNQHPIGYYMKFEEGIPLARVFTTAYQQRENFTNKDSLSLVDGMKTVVETAHKHNAILVDANELNWLVSRKTKLAEPRVIDVDSWAISNWKPSVIMPSIRDWHTHGFNEQSDWFSFAVVSFQVFTGIHPYKGMLVGYKPNDIEERMKKNLSVFTQGVRLNAAVRDISKIPGPLLDWYESVFQNGTRVQPPSPYNTTNKTPKAAIVQKTISTTSSGLLVLDVIFDGKNDIPVQVYSCGVVRFRSGKMVNLTNGKFFNKMFEEQSEVVSTQWGYLVGEINKEKELSFSLVSNDGHVKNLPNILRGTKLVRMFNRLFVVTAQRLSEVTVKKFSEPLLVVQNTWQVLGQSTNWFNGVGVQDAMGASYLIVPFDENACQYVRTPNLDGKRVINAIAGNRYVALAVLEPKTGLYKKYEFVFNKDYTDFQCTITDISTPDLNIAVLPKGVCTTLVDDGKLQIKVPINGVENHVNDTKIDSSFVLYNWENRVLAITGSKVWSVSLKP